MTTVVTRPATEADANAAVEVLRRSIVELCEADHRGDPETLREWLANKTPDRFKAWMANPERFTVVVELEGAVRGVGMLGREGTIHVCYVHPEGVRRGVGRALVDALEDQARTWGLDHVHLDASRTAIPFYEAMGYRPDGEPTRGFGVTRCNPYAKALRPSV